MSRASTATRKATKGEFIETDSGNKVWRRAHISGAPNITLGGKTVIQADVQLRGDLARVQPPRSQGDGKAAPVNHSISIGRCTIVSAGSVIKPPHRVSKREVDGRAVKEVHYYPMKISDNVFIGPNCTIQAANIGQHVHIGEGCVLQALCVVKENVKILPYTVVPPNMTIPSNSVVGGRPARIVGELGDGWGMTTGSAGGDNEGWVEGGDLRELVRAIR
ncbi:trimeric LpxA-like protein [Aulographum hederae CBS 113979]|uniref:Dynactin subunit 5 n=1 Tax=Aulographum hederae CBS 113979 TaxID=1176131 RepID=A0A6G1H054_9PEZI|nr:trimeric LpxA-like protein [Aulographum hederae CBS 113979]